MEQKRPRDYGLVIGRYPTGEHNAITDVHNVRVGHSTVLRDSTQGVEGSQKVRTGVTTVWPNAEPWRNRVYAGTSVLNGYGELVGITHIGEWGLLPTPIVMTSSLSIGLAYDATAKWITRSNPTLFDDVPMPVVTECDDGFLSDALSYPLSENDVFAALEGATAGPVEEGCVGSGTGMQCFDFKGGIGTASRVLPADEGGYTVGALVMTNFGSRPDLLIGGVPIGREITDLLPVQHVEGSAIALVATDAPMLPHQLRRMAVRAGLGLGRCGSVAENWSGEIQAAFSTAQTIPLESESGTMQITAIREGADLQTSTAINGLFRAAIETVEESVVNALFAAETTDGRDGHVLHALPIDRTLEILERRGRLEK